MDESSAAFGRRLTSPPVASSSDFQTQTGLETGRKESLKSTPQLGTKNRWNQFKTLMMLPNLGSSHRGSKQQGSSSIRGHKKLEENMTTSSTTGRKRSNSAISLLFGNGNPQNSLAQHYSNQLVSHLSALQQQQQQQQQQQHPRQHPPIASVMQQSTDSTSSESRNYFELSPSQRRISNDQESLSGQQQRRSPSPALENQLMIQSLPPTTSLTNAAISVTGGVMPSPNFQRRASADESRNLLRVESTLAEFRNSLAILKMHLQQRSYLRTQLENDVNALLTSLHRVLAACPDIANASDIHLMANTLLRISAAPSATLPPQHEGIASLNNTAATCGSNATAAIEIPSLTSNSNNLASSNSTFPKSSSSVVQQQPSTVVAAVISAVVVPHQLKSDVQRCADGLAILVIRRLSRQISVSVLSDLKEQIIDEEYSNNFNKTAIINLESSTFRHQHQQQGDPAPGHPNFYQRRYHRASAAAAAPTSRLARSMNDVSQALSMDSAVPLAVADSAMATPVIHASSFSSTQQALQAQQDVLFGVNSISAAMSPEELDLIVVKLCRADGSVEALLEQLRLADRYLKDVATYVEKRTLFYMDYVKCLNKLASNLKPSLANSSASSTVPLQYIFLPLVQHDIEYTSLALRSCQAQLSERDGFVSIITERRTEIKRSEKTMQERWSRVVGLYVAAMSEMRKAHQQYERAVDVLSKRRDEECLAKEADAQIQLRTKIMEVNHKLNQLEKTKSDCLYEIIKQIGITETTLKDASEKYFHFISIIICEHPSVYEAMRSQSRCIEVGSQFMAEVKRIISESNHFIFEPIEFEQLRKSVKAQNDNSGTSVLASSITSMIPLPRAFRVPLTVITSFDSDDESPSRSSSPTPPEGSDLYESTTVSAGGSIAAVAAATVSTGPGHGHRRRKTRQESISSSHSLSKLRTSSARCAICRAATVYEQGVKCDKCGLVFHRKCVDNNATLCDSRRRSPIFGIDLAAHLADTGQPVPLVLQKCMTLIERDALAIKGIYRVPGAKKQIEAVCRALEEGSGNSVSLEDEQPHVLTGIVKSYLLQLPEPLFTTKLASALLRSSREDRLTVEELQVAVKRLPEANYLTCGFLLQHLKVVAAHADENQMTIGNLAIIFGPTLLLSVFRGHQTSSATPSESGEMWSTSMADTVHSSKVIERLLTHFEIVFDNLPLFLSDLRRFTSNGVPEERLGQETSPARILKTASSTEEPSSSQYGSPSAQVKLPVSRQSSNPNLSTFSVLNDEPTAAALGAVLGQTCSPASSPASSKQSSPGPLPLATTNVTSAPLPAPVLIADLPPPTLTTILPFKPLQTSSAAFSTSSTAVPSSSSPSFTSQVNSGSAAITPPPLVTTAASNCEPVGNLPTSHTDNSIQSASVSTISGPKKTSNVIVRL